ncbi:hypothetical protein M0R45_013075 [Rubus argutus]|uniref:Disease resistance RPP13-like protein 4 n=1 Tax=Rubus argutus TaxID=59490 RepID=A0AAW1XJJ6_RUBAR
MSTRTLATTSFKTPYVSLDLLSFLKSGQVTPFQIFNDVIMPDFKDHISRGNNSDEQDDLIPISNETQRLLGEIQDALIPISEACRRLQQGEYAVSQAVKELAFQSLDDAFKERTKVTLENSTGRSNFLWNKLNRTRSIVFRLKELVCSPSPSPSVMLNDDNLKPSDTGEELQGLNKEKIEAIYNDLDERLRPCFLCFSVFPEGAVIKKKVLIHWWVGEGFIDTLATGGGNTAEAMGNQFFEEFLGKGIIEPVYKKRRPSADSCKMQPPIRDAVIELAQEYGFFDFDNSGNPTEDFSSSQRACLVRTIEGSNVRELPFRSGQEKVRSLINVNEPHLYFRPNWFSKMKSLKVLQLGKWQRSEQHLIEVENCEFLKGLKNMKDLRYLSLRGVSRITELPASICKARNLRILNLNGCCDLEKLPKGIGSLKNLTHLDMYECYLISSMPKGLALLSQLQVLKGFVISKAKTGGQDCKLADLSKLQNLRKLSIHIDRKLAKTAESELNSLTEFKKLRSLSISWSRIYGKPATQTLHRTLHRTLAKKITSMPKLTKQPSMAPIIAPDSPLPLLLEKLDLHYYPHSNMPNWLRPVLLRNLKKLYIRGGSLSDLCHSGIECRWTVQMVRLKFLDELQMDWGKLQNLFPNLNYLEISECPKLKFDQCDENGVWKRADSEQEEASSSNA